MFVISICINDFFQVFLVMSTHLRIFETSYAKANQSVLRWATVAIAAVLTVIVLIWAAIVWTKGSFDKDVQSEIERERVESGGETMGTSKTMRLMTMALCFLITIASTFLSWYVAALHMQSNNLIAFDVLQIVALILLAFGSYFFYKETRSRGATMTCLGWAAVLELVALVVLLASPTRAGPNGVVTQSALYVPLFVSTIAALGMAATVGRKA
jgi:hypothetical protein